MSITQQERPPASVQAAVSARGLWAGYDRRPALEEIDFSVPVGSIVGLVGPNGSGKSTLLKIVLGLLRPWRGEVSVFGRPVNKIRARVAYTPQAELVDWQFPVTVADVVMMGRYGRLGPLRRPGSEDREAVQRSLEQVGIAGLKGRQIGELSGGQQQRMLVARALAQEADLLLLDEPMVALDVGAQHELLDLFEELRGDGKTLLVATHDLTCVAECFDVALLLNRRLVAQGRPEEVFTRELLNEAYGSHMMLLPIEGGVYGVHHRYG
jgi:manganese/iron transport system ATP-binding protein